MDKRYFVTSLKILLCMLCLTTLAGCTSNKHKIITHLEDKYDEEFEIYGAEESILGEESAFVVQAVEHDNMPFKVIIEDNQIHDFYKERSIGKEIEDVLAKRLAQKNIQALIECSPTISNTQWEQLAQDSKQYNYINFVKEYKLLKYGIRVILMQDESCIIEDVMDIIMQFYNEVNFDMRVSMSLVSKNNFKKVEDIVSKSPYTGKLTIQEYFITDEIDIYIDNNGISMSNEDIIEAIGMKK